MLLVAGATLAFFCVQGIAHGSLRPHVGSGEPVLPVVLAIGSSWAILQVVGTSVGWLIIGFLSTSVYPFALAAQLRIAARPQA